MPTQRYYERAIWSELRGELNAMDDMERIVPDIDDASTAEQARFNAALEQVQSRIHRYAGPSQS